MTPPPNKKNEYVKWMCKDDDLMWKFKYIIHKHTLTTQISNDRNGQEHDYSVFLGFVDKNNSRCYQIQTIPRSHTYLRRNIVEIFPSSSRNKRFVSFGKLTLASDYHKIVNQVIKYYDLYIYCILFFFPIVCLSLMSWLMMKCISCQAANCV